MQLLDEELSKLFSDATRLKIFRAVEQSCGQGIKVTDIAENFGLHPNVARMHLEKLTAAGFLTSEFQKGNGSGRPARKYFLGDRVFSLQFPYRNYELLADISLAGTLANKKTRFEARIKGREIATKFLEKMDWKPGQSSQAELLLVLKDLTQELGLNANINRTEDGKLEVKVFNCIFKELSTKHKHVCNLHKELFSGSCDILFKDFKIFGSPGISNGDKFCCFKISLLA